MTHFHVGDRVKLVKGDRWEAEGWRLGADGMMIGKIYLVSEIDNDGWISKKKGVFFHHPDHFKLVSKKKAEWSVVKIQGASILYYKNRSRANFDKNRTLARKVAKWLNEEER
jgi:hypothetical protein